MDIDLEAVEHDLRRQFEFRLPAMVARQANLQTQPFIPDAFFAQASAECQRLFVEGHDYACILLTQAVAEGIARFLAEKNNVKVFANDHRAQINLLQHAPGPPAITPAAFSAFRKIRGKPCEDRNDFHHMNSNVEQSCAKLEQRAKQCIESLYLIEAEVFAFEYGNGGTLVLANPHYWPSAGANEVMVYVQG
ncbi:MAG: hypothetical protein SGJ19_13305 [Planctomycetia bacterium]|nr:hypothetical protein [Planctomycetia bacterium]